MMLKQAAVLHVAENNRSGCDWPRGLMHMRRPDARNGRKKKKNGFGDVTSGLLSLLSVVPHTHTHKSIILDGIHISSGLVYSSIWYRRIGIK